MTTDSLDLTSVVTRWHIDGIELPYEKRMRIEEVFDEFLIVADGDANAFYVPFVLSEKTGNVVFGPAREVELERFEWGDSLLEILTERGDEVSISVYQTACVIRDSETGDTIVATATGTLDTDRLDSVAF